MNMFVKCTQCQAWRATPEQRAQPRDQWAACQRRSAPLAVDFNTSLKSAPAQARTVWSLTPGDRGGCCEGVPLEPDAGPSPGKPRPPLSCRPLK